VQATATAFGTWSIVFLHSARSSGALHDARWYAATSCQGRLDMAVRPGLVAPRRGDLSVDGGNHGHRVNGCSRTCMSAHGACEGVSAGHVAGRRQPMTSHPRVQRPINCQNCQMPRLDGGPHNACIISVDPARP
jgi:hypothetical protein